MKFSVHHSFSLNNLNNLLNVTKQPGSILVLGVFEDGKLTPTALELDNLSQGFLQTILKKGDFKGKIKETALLYHVPSISSERVLLVGCGKEGQLKEQTFRSLVRHAFQKLKNCSIQQGICFLTELNVNHRPLDWKIRQLVELMRETAYCFDKLKSISSPGQRPPSAPEAHWIFPTPLSEQESRNAVQAIAQGEAIASGMDLAKDLINLPANLCTPPFLAQKAFELAQNYPVLQASLLEEKDLHALGMGALLAVGQGSLHPSRLVTLKYNPLRDNSAAQQPIVLIGKGITFDTGGNSLKSSSGMMGMKYDMSGAATVLALLRIAAQLDLPIPLVGILPIAENMPGSAAIRPDDVITTLSGTTVEVLNTDAEGRLILCDALTFSERFNPELVIDVATLTGAATVALGRQANALLSNDRDLAQALLAAGILSGDRCWELPLWEEYEEALQSNVADLSNASHAGEAGTIIGATFLAHFAKKLRWAHLDIAATANTSSGKDRAPTGRPISLLAHFLLMHCQVIATAPSTALSTQTKNQNQEI